MCSRHRSGTRHTTVIQPHLHPFASHTQCDTISRTVRNTHGPQSRQHHMTSKPCVHGTSCTDERDVESQVKRAEVLGRHCHPCGPCGPCGPRGWQHAVQEPLKAPKHTCTRQSVNILESSDPVTNRHELSSHQAAALTVMCGHPEATLRVSTRPLAYTMS